VHTPSAYPWYQDDVRIQSVCVTAMLCVLCTACGSPGRPEPTGPVSSAPGDGVHPANIMRVRSELPEGYEVADLTGPASPVAFWGFGAGWSAEPVRCGALGDPAQGNPQVRGWSASGPGGIVYAVVADEVTELDATVGGDCARWTVTSGHTSGTVATIQGPDIEAATTVGMSVDTITVVEGGSETRSTADTFVAHLAEHVVHVTVVGDPGSTTQALGPEFASQLLSSAVSALRSTGAAG
jgi:hypothetical protein